MARAQSAMEYLMTYGWAILIIAIVLAALFQLGVFSSSTFAPKAPPGSCQVFRPNGPGSTQFINTEGVCNGELPQYVGGFNGASSYILAMPQIPQISAGGQGKITVTVWAFRSSSPSSSQLNIMHYGGGVECSSTDNNFEIFVAGGTSPYNAYALLHCSNYLISTHVLSSTWVFYAVTFNGSTEKGYAGMNGQLMLGSTNTGISNVVLAQNSPLLMGGSGPFDGYWPGMLANMQVYNTTLSANEIQALYLEGIGGAPVDLQNLVGWWPLNGNAHDYSGNNNNGQINGGVTFTNSWESGYTQP